MNKLLARAFEKLEKREHRIRVLREQRALRRISQAVYHEEAQKVDERYALTFEEKMAYENHLRRARKTK
jgi:hypothetical protein